MSGALNSSAGPVTEYGLRGQLLADSQAAQRRVGALTAEAASGYVADTYAGLVAGARTSLDLAPQIAGQAAISKGIAEAAGRIGLTQNALQGITQVAQTLFSQLNTLNGLNASQIDDVAAQARSALAQVAGLLDTADGGTYVFAGKDGGNAPVSSPDAILTSGFYSQINAAVGKLAANGAAPTAAATLAVAASNAAGTTPFSAYLSAAASAGTDVRPTVETGPGTRTVGGIVANANGDVSSSGTATTGSYARDILRALATVGSLSSGQAGASGFQALVQDVRTSLGGAITAIAADAGALGVRQAGLTATASASDAAVVALTKQVSDVQDADLASVSTWLSQAQIQLQASYQLIAGINKLSLVQYL